MSTSELIRKASKCILSATDELGEGASQDAIEARAIQLMRPAPEKLPPTQRDRAYHVIAHASNHIHSTVESLGTLMAECTSAPDGSLGTSGLATIQEVFDALLKVSACRLR